MGSKMKISRKQIRKIIKEALLLEEPSDYAKDLKAGNITRAEYNQLVRDFENRNRSRSHSNVSSTPAAPRKKSQAMIDLETKPIWKGTPKELEKRVHKYLIDIGFYLDRGEARLCKILNATKKSDVVLVGVAYNFMVVMAVVLPIDMLFQYLTRGANSLLLYQKAITQIVYHLELLLGTDIYVRGEHSTILAYRNSIDMEIVAECTGLHETIFLALLILCFRGVKPSVRIKWAFYGALFFFTENIIRILSGYHLIMRYGFTTWDKFHFFWWHTGQYALIMSVFLLWIMIIASKPDNKSPKKSY